ncbi:MAG TPA: hypothetical protein VGH33_20040 [Isosphaeraceae bacterium]|jgi:hypothetical protein
MGEQATVHSIEALKDFRAALATFGEEASAALGAVNMEVRRTIQWVQYDRRTYWQEQIKRRREQVAMAQAELFRRKLAKTADNNPAMSEQKELLRKAEASLREAEVRAGLVKKWEPALQQAALEYRASTRRIGAVVADVPRAIFVLGRMVEALEAYLREAPPSAGEAGAIGSIVGPALGDEAWAETPETPESDGAEAGPDPLPEAR